MTVYVVETYRGCCNQHDNWVIQSLHNAMEDAFEKVREDIEYDITVEYGDDILLLRNTESRTTKIGRITPRKVH